MTDAEKAKWDWKIGDIVEVQTKGEFAVGWAQCKVKNIRGDFYYVNFEPPQPGARQHHDRAWRHPAPPPAADWGAESVADGGWSAGSAAAAKASPSSESARAH